MYGELLCLKDGDSFCFPTFATLHNATLQNTNNAILSQYCGSCVSKSLTVVASYGTFASTYPVGLWKLSLERACFKDGGNFCYTELSPPQVSSCLQNGSAFDTGCLNIVCNNCFYKITTAAAAYYDGTTEGTELLAQRDYVCSKNGKQSTIPTNLIRQPILHVLLHGCGKSTN
jgi:hypothetical protein